MHGKMVKSGLIFVGHIRPGPDMIFGATLVFCRQVSEHQQAQIEMPAATETEWRRTASEVYPACTVQVYIGNGNSPVSHGNPAICNSPREYLRHSV